MNKECRMCDDKKCLPKKNGRVIVSFEKKEFVPIPIKECLGYQSQIRDNKRFIESLKRELDK
jgi:hypothetical protein